MFSLHLEQDNPKSSNFQESVQWCLCIFCSISIFAVCLFANDTSQRIRCVTVSVQARNCVLVIFSMYCHLL